MNTKFTLVMNSALFFVLALGSIFTHASDITQMMWVIVFNMYFIAAITYKDKS